MTPLDWRALLIEGEHGRAIYEESFPAGLDFVLGAGSPARAAFDDGAARSVLHEYVDLWPALPSAPAPRVGRVVARLLPPVRAEMALVFYAVELAPRQFVVASCEALHH